MDLEFLFDPVEDFDAWLTGLFDGAPLVVTLFLAFALGLRHATDPDHLVAVTSLVAARDGDTRAAARLGGWWGVGHGATLATLGLPLIVLKSETPAWLESGAEKAVGAVIVVLAARVLVRWFRGDYRRHVHRHVRTARQAFGIGVLHGLAGTGAVVVLLIAALPSQAEAALALMVFAPMSIASMTACTSAFAWAFTRPVIDPVYRSVIIPVFGVLGLAFGAWYVTL